MHRTVFSRSQWIQDLDTVLTELQWADTIPDGTT